MQTPSKATISPNKPALQRDDAEHLTSIADICISVSTQKTRSEDLLKLSSGIISDRKQYGSLHSLGVFDLAIKYTSLQNRETIDDCVASINPSANADPVISRFIKKIVSEFALSTQRATPYPLMMNAQSTSRYLSLCSDTLLFHTGPINANQIKSIKGVFNQQGKTYDVSYFDVEGGTSTVIVDSFGMDLASDNVGMVASDYVDMDTSSVHMVDNSVDTDSLHDNMETMDPVVDRFVVNDVERAVNAQKRYYLKHNLKNTRKIQRFEESIQEKIVTLKYKHVMLNIYDKELEKWRAHFTMQEAVILSLHFSSKFINTRKLPEDTGIRREEIVRY